MLWKFKGRDKRASAAGKRSLIKIMAIQFAVAAAIFCALLIFRGIDHPAAQKGYETVMKAFMYNIPVSDNDDDIGKIKFVDKIREQTGSACFILTGLAVSFSKKNVRETQW